MAGNPFTLYTQYFGTFSKQTPCGAAALAACFLCRIKRKATEKDFKLPLSMSMCVCACACVCSFCCLLCVSIIRN